MALASGAACLLLAAVVIALVQGVEPAWLADLDARPADLARDVADLGWLHGLLRVVEVVFGTWGTPVITAGLAFGLLNRKHDRAAAYTVGVVVATWALTGVLQVATGRLHPDWLGEPLDRGALPSAPAALSAALAGTGLVLLQMLVRRGSVRRASGVAIIAGVVLVGAAAVLLADAHPTDVVAGWLLGAGATLVGLGVYSPLPRSHAESAPKLPEVVPSGHRLAVVLNPSKVEDPGQFRSIVTGMAADAGWTAPTWHYTTVEDSGTGMAHDAAVDGADLVLVCGGDGTVREVCAELAGTGIPVGIIPAGTGNLLARNLEIPLYLRAAVDVALTGQDRAIDLVEVSGDHLEDTHFMVMAGMGLDAAMMEGVNEDIKKKVGWPAYVLSGAKALMFPPERIDISVDDGEFTRHRARTVVVGNVGFLQAGMPLLPDAAIDDGLLDVVVLHPRRFLSWIPLALRVLTKRRRTDETINRMTGRTVVLRAHGDVPRQLDGDTVGPGRELRMTCVHGKLLVRVPR